ncbi:MAG: tRNA (cytidine(34)-2'-O)-methyltransferase [Acidimicrobiales bacterium]|nr:tRNA (cytidine(34)-2'-O)-methyltransferase [Hyphomonadaceae bacterium]RZV43241.1 MAG: tRNA (cytidine(34)-2'-O)-methyltransferase [Acidimicrobiales bacterium]
MKIVLFQPDIAQNLGAAMRLSACLGVSLEIIEPCGFPLTSKAVRRTAMDYGVPDQLIRHKNWNAFEKSESTAGRRIVLLTTKSALPITEFEFNPDDTLLFGQESAGAPEHVHTRSDARIYIPLANGMRSLNLVSSASIAVFEALRQSGGLPPTIVSE